MRFRDWYPCKKVTEEITLGLASLLRETRIPDFFLAWMTLFLHVVGGLTLVIFLLFFPLNSLYSLLCLSWCLVIFSNAYFHGCILSRLERHFFHSDSWYGPVSLGNFLLQFWFAEITKEIANFVIKYCFAVPVSLVVLLRLGSSSEIQWIFFGLLLGSFFSMFAFESSQKLCIDTLFDGLAKFEQSIQ